MRHASLFSGIGGFDLAADWMGWENVFHCEWNEFGHKVLKHYWPNTESFHDITKTDFTKYANRIDILTGGFPCQPYSMAGKRKGKEDERHLWPEMLRCIREVKPRWVVGENVYGLVNWDGGLVFHEVQSDLEIEGYEVFPYVLPACAINAPHRRDRVFFIAYSREFRLEFCETSRTMGKGQNQICGKGNKSTLQSETKSEIRTFTNSNNTRFKTFNNKKSKLEPKNRTKTFSGNSFESIYSRNWWQTFPTVSPICDGDDGISDRLDSITFSKWRKQSIMAGGNAVVPQLIYILFKTISKFEELKTKQC